jgi:hypothetical protein
MTHIGVLLYILVYIFTEAMFLVFDFLDIIENWELRDQLAIYILITVVLYSITVVTIYIYFSGTPYRNQTYATKMRKISLIFLLWSVCLLPKSILDLSGVSGYPDGEISNDY